jgi:hypothetical protein
MPDFDVRRIEHSEAKPFIERWHYSGVCPTGYNLFFGAFLEGELYAVAAYGMGANMDKGASIARATGLPVRYQNITPKTLEGKSAAGLTIGPLNCLELRRLCRQGAKKEAKIPLTRFLSLCHKRLKREGIAYVVSYSDPGELRTERVGDRWQVVSEQQNTGGIYRAANFKHLGATDPQAHTVRESDGIIFHRRTAYREMKRWNAKHPDQPKALDAVRKERGLVPIVTPPKERWFLVL